MHSILGIYWPSHYFILFHLIPRFPQHTHGSVAAHLWLPVVPVVPLLSYPVDCRPFLGA